MSNDGRKSSLGEIQEKYLIFSKPSIISILRDLARKPEIITAYLDGGSAYFLTAVLGVLPERGLIVFDPAPDEKTNDAVLRCKQLVCVAFYAHVNVRFTCTTPVRAKYQGQTVFASPLPESVYRPQRRQFFRVTTPVYQPIRLRIPRLRQGRYEFPVADLSGGGLAILDPDSEFSGNPGDLIERCGLDLPGFGPVTFDLEIRSRLRVSRPGGSKITRIGCQFHNLTSEGTALLHRYLNKLQMELKR